jgi:hypothetical protein
MTRPVGRSSRPDVPYLPAGGGIDPLRDCMGCNGKRPGLGGRGVGVRWRCAECVKGKV